MTLFEAVLLVTSLFASAYLYSFLSGKVSDLESLEKKEVENKSIINKKKKYVAFKGYALSVFIILLSIFISLIVNALTHSPYKSEIDTANKVKSGMVEESILPVKPGDVENLDIEVAEKKNTTDLLQQKISSISSKIYKIQSDIESSSIVSEYSFFPNNDFNEDSVGVLNINNTFLELTIDLFPKDYVITTKTVPKINWESLNEALKKKIIKGDNKENITNYLNEFFAAYHLDPVFLILNMKEY